MPRYNEPPTAGEMQDQATPVDGAEPMFYLQDTRGVVGNSMSWWALGSNGYTCDLKKAQTFTMLEAQDRMANRSTDKPWPKAYIDARAQHHVDIQTVIWDEATKDVTWNEATKVVDFNG